MVENIQQKRLFRNQSRIYSKNLVQVTNLRNSGEATAIQFTKDLKALFQAAKTAS